MFYLNFHKRSVEKMSDDDFARKTMGDREIAKMQYNDAFSQLSEANKSGNRYLKSIFIYFSNSGEIEFD
jgi:hypothetical protein